jgi:hypothetical protein
VRIRELVNEAVEVDAEPLGWGGVFSPTLAFEAICGEIKNPNLGEVRA